MGLQTMVVFHRCGGKSLGYPPNTLLTAKWAVGYGARAIEYDIVACNNGRSYSIVGIEPKLLKQSGLDIDNLDWAEVSKINTGNEKFGICTAVFLEEMLTAIDTSKVAHQIHIKGSNPQMLGVLLPKLQGVENYVLTTFDIAVIKQIKHMSGNTPVGWIVKPKQEKGTEGLEDLTAAVTENPDAFESYTDSELEGILMDARTNSVNVVILCAPRIKSKNIVQKVKDAGFEVGAWGVGSNLELAKQLIEYQINRFTLDNPEQLSGVLL